MLQEVRPNHLLNTLTSTHIHFATNSSDSSSSNNSPGRHAKQISEFSVDESPTQKVRTLKEIYESCSFSLAVIDPSCFEKEKKNQHIGKKLWQKKFSQLQEIKHRSCVNYHQRKGLLV